MRPPALLALLLAALLGLTGCAGGSPAADLPVGGQRAEPAAETVEYVALGDSFSSGPLISTLRGDPAGCGRSTNNYPAFLADWLDVASYVDRTCAGATTRDLTRSQRLQFGGPGRVPPQVDALNEDTDLVTVGIGGNDFGVFSTLIGCFAPQQGWRLTCGPDARATMLDSVARLEPRVERALREVGRRAPNAEVLLVGYPRVLPADGSCAVAGIRGVDADAVRRVETRLDAALRRAADAAGATWVDLADASRGHDVCAGRAAWVNGPQVRMGQAAPFHPFVAGMRGAAAAAYTQLTGEDPPAGNVARPGPGVTVLNPPSG